MVVLLFWGRADVVGQEIFRATVSSQRVVQNSVFDIRFELTEAEGSNFQSPPFPDFKLVGGPARGSSTMIINGVVSRSESWSYSLLATKTGKFTIGAASVVAGRQKLTTKPLTIEVVAAKESVTPGITSTGNEGVLLVAEIEDKKYYPGQQIVLNYRILFRENVQTVNILSEDDYSDFFIQYFSGFSKEPSLVRIKGVEYTSRIIKSIALYAHQSGTYVIDPMVMDVGINAPFPGIQGFFTMRRIQDLRVTSQPLTLTIVPLPDGAPSTFNGAVGQYTMKTISGSGTLTTDDALTFQIEISGNGDSRRWDPPAVVADSTFEIYEPKILDDALAEEEGLVVHRRSVEYQLLPRISGEHQLYIPFTYFDPELQKYVTLSSDTMRIQVSQGTHARIDRNTETDEYQNEKLLPVRQVWLSDRFWSSWPHLLLFGLIVTGSCWNLILARKQKRENRIPESQRLRETAGIMALHQLDELQLKSGQLSGKEFYETATAIFHRFLSARFNIPPADLDETRLPIYLDKAGVHSDIAERVKTLFSQSLVVRYGGIPSGYTREEMMAACRSVIDQL